MKELDRVELIKERAEYREAGVEVGDKGTIMGEERNGYVLVYFDGEIYQDKDGVYCTTEKDVGVRVEDLKVIPDNE
ncbi:MAG TPA: hypothetical protein DCG79_01675 [Clostridiales bacterium]|nr:hypothetical protein [Clostridiales bacterium]